MPTRFETLISAAQLQALASNDNLLIVDVRHDLANPLAGRQAYDDGHIAEAIFLNLDADLSGAKSGRNGRHPLPEREQFAARLAALGVNDSTQVVAYDAQGGMYAARLWWMLRWLGHAQVAVLDGGWPAWLAVGGATSTAPAKTRPAGNFVARPSLAAQVSADEVLRTIGQAQHCIVDARAPDRFRGENETLDPVGGHIPGARNRFFRENLQADGIFKPAHQLREEFAKVMGAHAAANIIMQCGSGVTACHNLLAMEVAGLPGAALYPGSWSEWSADPTRPVETGA